MSRLWLIPAFFAGFACGWFILALLVVNVRSR